MPGRSPGPSPRALVKTAIHGADPNWGRIVSAAGYAGVPFREEELSLWINGVPVYQDGAPVPFDADRSPDGSRTDARWICDCPWTRAWPAAVLDVRPDRRVHPAQRRLHDVSRLVSGQLAVELARLRRRLTECRIPPVASRHGRLTGRTRDSTTEGRETMGSPDQPGNISNAIDER